jgi:hypothetical protein
VTSDALNESCEVCGAEPGEACRNTLKPGQPLPGRLVHMGRIEAVDK